jgi:hypothetical protein
LLEKGILSLELDPDSNSAFSELRKTGFLRALLWAFSWRKPSLAKQILPTCIPNLANSYKPIRDSLGGIVSYSLYQHWRPVDFGPNDWFAAHAGSAEVIGPLVRHLKERLPILRAEKAVRAEKTIGSSPYVNFSKTGLWCDAHHCSFTSEFLRAESPF